MMQKNVRPENVRYYLSFRRYRSKILIKECFIMANIFKNEKFLCALCGAAAVIVGKKILTAKKTRQLAVSGLAKGMKLSHDAKEAFRNMKDEASDICYDAKVAADLADTETDTEENDD